MFILSSQTKACDPVKSIILEKMSTLPRVSTHIYGVSRKIDGEIFIFQANLGIWPPQINGLEKNNPSYEGLNTHLWGFQVDRWENVHISSKPSHGTTQINHLKKIIPLLMVSTQHL